MKNTFTQYKRNPLKSMTYRLPATYAVIALLVVLALGLVLYMTLRWYYATQERAYLEENAVPISAALQHILPGENQDFLQTQVHFFSFLARTRVEIFDDNGVLLASGNTFDQDPMFASSNNNRGFFISSDRIAGAPSFDYLLISPTNTNDVVIQNGADQIQIRSLDGNYTVQTQNAGEVNPDFDFVGIAGTPFTDIIPAFDPNRSPIKRAWDSYSQSSRVVYSTTIEDANGNLLGTLRLSDGPAYGGQIIKGVMYGWLLASTVSVGLAVVLGWVASQDVVNPLKTLSYTTQQMAEGDLSARVVINRDDEFGMLSNSFNEMAQRIEETISTLRHFMSDAAHEINTPITALRTNLELISPEKGIHNVERALAQVKRLENLTRNLLQLSKLESDIDSVSVTLIDAVDLMKGVAQFHASQAEQADIDLKLEMPETPLMIRANAEQMQQALANLVHNAIKFTDANGEVRISVQGIQGDVRFTVEDTGIGIPETDLPFLFNRFHRGRNATRYEGNGLGLAIVETIVKRYGGVVIAENMLTGTCFSVTLPQANHE